MRGFQALLAAIALLATAPLAAAHAGHAGAGLDQALTQDGARVQLGALGAPQPGPVIVVPDAAGPIACGVPAGYLVDLGGGAGVSFASNATLLAATFDLPSDAYAAFAVDTHDAVRTLSMMQEDAVALHALAAVVAPLAGNATLRSGELGVPYAIPGAGAHAMALPAEESDVRMAYDSPAPPVYCGSTEPGHVTLAFDRSGLPSTAPGSLVHVVALVDTSVAGFLPHPLDSTRVLQANLYLVRPGEDARQIEAALSPRPTAQALVPMAGAGAGLALLALRRP